jgi:hypothetical protein
MYQRHLADTRSLKVNYSELDLQFALATFICVARLAGVRYPSWLEGRAYVKTATRVAAITPVGLQQG